MTRILLVETASPRRVLRKAEELLGADLYPEPEITVVCRENSRRLFAQSNNIKVYPLTFPEKRRIADELNRKKFDVLFMFWTGEKEYRTMKFFALRLKAATVYVESGDGNLFRLTWKAICRHALFRWKHPLPADHWDFVMRPSDFPATEPQPSYGEKVLILQSAEPYHVLRALRRLQEKPLFQNPHYTIFCRNKPEVTRSFESFSMISRLLTHSETRRWWEHLRNLRRERFDVAVIFYTGDPGYWKIKIFAFLLGARRTLIFNESADCFYLSFRPWINLLQHRMSRLMQLRIRPQATLPLYIFISFAIKTFMLPFRFLWLLLVWLKLRFVGWKMSGYSHDDAI